MIWFTIDVEEVTDMNFHILWKGVPDIEYEDNIDFFLKSVKDKKIKTAFVLGSFAKKYPHIIKKIHSRGVEIACHGYYHNLVYREDFKDWSDNIKRAKELLEDMLMIDIKGYRSPSWSMPFEKRYYEELKRLGFFYSSSYFPMKNYMYGNSINRTKPFFVYTKYGKIEERPIPKYIIPFSGGFYLRILPLSILKLLFKRNLETVLYIHPYELQQGNLITYFKKYTKINLDYFLAFYSFGSSRSKLKEIVKSE